MPAPTASPAANKADVVANYVKERGGNKVIRKVRLARRLGWRLFFFGSVGGGV